MPNLYTCTNLDGWSGGKQNRTIPHDARTPKWDAYANSVEEAIEQMHTMFPKRDFDAVLVTKNATLPLEEAA